MEIVKYTSDVDDLWNDFCESETDAWFWHTTHWMKYCLISSFHITSINASFLIMDQRTKEIIAVIPLFVESNDGHNEFTYGGGPTPCYIVKSSLSDKISRNIKDLIFQETNRIAVYNQVKRISINLMNELQVGSDKGSLFLLKNNYIDTRYYTSVLNLQKPDEEILLGMTKGHRSAIKSSLQSGITIVVYDRKSITAEKFQSFKDAYFQAAGKITRPLNAFELLFYFIQIGYASIFESFYEGKSQGYVYVFYYKKYAYYAMSCRSYEKEVSNSHSIQWKVIGYLRDIGIAYYELGEQSYGNTFFHPTDEKKVSISGYKRGFGGAVIPQITGEYFYSEEYFREVYLKRIKQFNESNF
ncbi:hypothetical protein SAMN03159341_111123 [Paenibacillus sp. 1_12]|uniref:hypothetical protein n=1 Tax=Paenibacillus sp. 1_12 TaxID=1566278 RepID=UPI0008F41FED|nr:hypothetical protein [Paenibacillus sp. 1_12]SFL89259.1 hypothetical protein SAMN03159341_111123 [Paenibacillus sp. 1_12]